MLSSMAGGHPWAAGSAVRPPWPLAWGPAGAYSLSLPGKGRSSGLGPAQWVKQKLTTCQAALSAPTPPRHGSRSRRGSVEPLQCPRLRYPPAPALRRLCAALPGRPLQIPQRLPLAAAARRGELFGVTARPFKPGGEVLQLTLPPAVALLSTPRSPPAPAPKLPPAPGGLPMRTAHQAVFAPCQPASARWQPAALLAQLSSCLEPSGVAKIRNQPCRFCTLLCQGSKVIGSGSVLDPGMEGPSAVCRAGGRELNPAKALAVSRGAPLQCVCV